MVYSNNNLNLLNDKDLRNLVSDHVPYSGWIQFSQLERTCLDLDQKKFIESTVSLLLRL